MQKRPLDSKHLSSSATIRDYSLHSRMPWRCPDKSSSSLSRRSRPQMALQAISLRKIEWHLTSFSHRRSAGTFICSRDSLSSLRMWLQIHKTKNLLHLTPDWIARLLQKTSLPIQSVTNLSTREPPPAHFSKTNHAAIFKVVVTFSKPYSYSHVQSNLNQFC